MELIKYEDQSNIVIKLNMDYNSDLEMKIEEQSEEYWSYVDKLRHFKKKVLTNFIQHNGYYGKMIGHSDYVNFCVLRILFKIITFNQIHS